MNRGWVVRSKRELGITTPSPSPPLPFSHFPGPGVPLTTGHQAAGQVLGPLIDNSFPPLPLGGQCREEGGPGQGGGPASASRAGPVVLPPCSLNSLCATPSELGSPSTSPVGIAPPASSHGSCRRLSQVCPKHLQQEQVLSLLWFEGGPLSVCN